MLILLSPSKTMDFSKPAPAEFTIPDFLDNSSLLIKTLRKLSKEDISSLMSLSANLTELNAERYKKFSTPFTPENARPAAYAFQGDVYDGLQFDKLANDDIKYSQDHLRMLSGLYGVLRPLDLIQPYRLEMSTKLANKRGKDLYSFWGDAITEKLNAELASHDNKTVFNLASNEYFKAVKTKKLGGEIITPVFKEYKNGDYKIVMLFAKRARGAMANYIIRNKIENAAALKDFSEGDYKYNAKMSKDGEMVFVR